MSCSPDTLGSAWSTSELPKRYLSPAPAPSSACHSCAYLSTNSQASFQPSRRTSYAGISGVTSPNTFLCTNAKCDESRKFSVIERSPQRTSNGVPNPVSQSSSGSSAISGIDGMGRRSEEHTSELQSLTNLVCRLLLEKKKKQGTAPPDYALMQQAGDSRRQEA